jgi:hypothetical protein
MRRSPPISTIDSASAPLSPARSLAGRGDLHACSRLRLRRRGRLRAVRSLAVLAGHPAEPELVDDADRRSAQPGAVSGGGVG